MLETLTAIGRAVWDQSLRNTIIRKNCRTGKLCGFDFIDGIGGSHKCNEILEHYGRHHYFELTPGCHVTYEEFYFGSLTRDIIDRFFGGSNTSRTRMMNESVYERDSPEGVDRMNFNVPAVRRALI